MRRALYILGVLAAGLMLVGSVTVAALMSDKVETAAVQLATAEFSRALGTNAQVGAVEYRFPARLTLRDIYLEDQQRDTLLYVHELYAHFNPSALLEGEIHFSHVHLKEVVAKVYRIPNAEHGAQADSLVWNYQFLADAFKTEKKEKDPMRSMFAVRDVQLDDIRLRYEHHEVLLTHADMDLHHLSAEKLDAEISELAMTVRKVENLKSKVESGKSNSARFVVEDMKAHVILTDSMLRVPTLSARLPQSKFSMSEIALRLPFESASFDSPLHIEAQLVPADIGLFVPKVKGMKRSLTLSGSMSGTVDSLAFSNMLMLYNGQKFIEGDIAAIGLFNEKNPYLRANLTDLHTRAAQIQDFLSQLYGQPVTLAKPLHRVGEIHYRGLAEGRLHDLTLHGAFRTALGAISTDGTFRSDSLFKHMEYDARVVGRNFRLGRMLDAPKLTTVTLDLASKGRIDEGAGSGTIKAYVREFTYNNYTYADLHIDGRIQPRHYKGRLHIDDPHLKMAFDGVVNLHEQNPEINFSLRCDNFDTAPFSSQYSAFGYQPSLRTSFALAVDLNGKQADDISGYLVLDSLFLATPQDSALMQQLTLLVSAQGTNSKAITLRSDYLSAQLDGLFRYADVMPAFQYLAHAYLPSVVEAP